MTTISVVIPCFNDAGLLATCLAALAAQDRPADEVIVVDNASTDATAATARAAGARVVYEPVQGIWPAAAAGYDAATGDVIARLDADSVPAPDWLARLESGLARSPEADLITGTGDFYDSSPLVAWLGQTFYLGGYFFWVGLWLAHHPVFGSNFAMHRDVWLRARDRVHRERSDIHDDLDLSMNLDPAVQVRYEHTLRVGVSGRPFATWSGFARRVRWGFRTLLQDWPEDTPWRRRAARHRLRVRT
ncbi:glycosyltransferase family 2 protein [Cryobacterium sp. TMT1-21]|uniref:glycosyltransferase family A protein n=1 Tax=unclassified Cryobacterium TaxID=2649013 RepID=UPI00106BAA0F|nr:MULTISPECIES: glycosyltransferase [unclassified Cryobacterium]TFC85204.1 glycosyltransferase family 2 protein [Cryobacterium sp. TmT2-59]TFD17112.1 glycosyltransferase family 2 protein [Cryobacterium sp. TMT1-21]TFD36878.1 glycosyltransferase family 2 protein [Cryobacterium sp. TMT2-10]